MISVKSWRILHGLRSRQSLPLHPGPPTECLETEAGSPSSHSSRFPPCAGLGAAGMPRKAQTCFCGLKVKFSSSSCPPDSSMSGTPDCSGQASLGAKAPWGKDTSGGQSSSWGYQISSKTLPNWSASISTEERLLLKHLSDDTANDPHAYRCCISRRQNFMSPAPEGNIHRHEGHLEAEHSG